MSCVSESEIVVLLEELKRVGLLINRNAIEVVVKKEERGVLIYTIVLPTVIVHVGVSRNGIQYYEVLKENALVTAYYTEESLQGM